VESPLRDCGMCRRAVIAMVLHTRSRQDDLPFSPSLVSE
jgi:hypothetical protein